jgi:MFS family permease
MPHPPLTGLYVLALFGGILLAFDNPLRRSFVTEMVPDEDLANAVVLYSTIVNTARIFGPALAGLLIVTLGYGWGFALDAVSYLAVITCIIMMRPDELYRTTTKAPARGAVREGFRYIMAVPVLWLTFLMLAVNYTLAYNFNVTLPLFVTQGLHGGDGDFTALYSVLSAGAVVCALVIARRNIVTLHHILLGSGLLGLTMLLLAVVPNVPVAFPVIFLIGATSILYSNASSAMVQIRARHDMRGRVVSVQTIIIGGSAALGGPLLGWIADAAGTRILIGFGGIVCLIMTLLGYLASQYVHDSFSLVAEE